MYQSPTPLSPTVVRVMACLLGGAAIMSLQYGPMVLAVAVIALAVAAAVIQRWSQMIR